VKGSLSANNMLTAAGVDDVDDVDDAEAEGGLDVYFPGRREE